MPKQRYQLTMHPETEREVLLINQLNDILARLSAELGQLQGFDNATPTFYNSLDLQGKRVCRVGETRDDDDLPSRRELRKKSVFVGASGDIEANQRILAKRGIRSNRAAVDPEDIPTFAQLLKASGAGAGGSVTVGGTQTITGTKTFDAAFLLTADSPAQITANQNNYSLGGRPIQRLDTDASRNVTGFTAVTNALKVIINVGSNNLVLTHEDSNSSAANRLVNQAAGSLTLTSTQAAIYWYDGSASRWRQVN